MWLLDGRHRVKGPLGLAEHVSISLWTSFSEKCPEENASKTKEVTLRAVSSRTQEGPLGSPCQGSELQGDNRPVLGLLPVIFLVKAQLDRSLDLGSTHPGLALCPGLL